MSLNTSSQKSGISINSNNNSKAVTPIDFHLSFKKIAFYNFVFMGLCLLITTIIVYVKYSEEDYDNNYIKQNKTTIIAIILCCLFLSNMFVLLGVYIAKRYRLTPFTQIMVALASFSLGYLLGYYLGKAIGRLMSDKKKDKVDKDTAALQAAIAATKKQKEDGYSKQEMEAIEEVEHVKTTISSKIKSLLGLGSTKKRKIKVNEYPFKYSYGISFWFFVEAQPPNVGGAYAKFVNILNYGEKPSIKYKGATNELKITFRLNDGVEREILLYDQLKYQKWNHFIVNYDRGTVDVFINDELVATEPSIAPYMIHDEVVVGEKNGINGGIKDVKYFPEPIDLKTIKYLFRMY